MVEIIERLQRCFALREEHTNQRQHHWLPMGFSVALSWNNGTGKQQYVTVVCLLIIRLRRYESGGDWYED